MRVAVFDAGNTALKIGIFQKEELIEFLRVSYDRVERIKAPEYEVGVLISVVEEINGYLSRIFPKLAIIRAEDLEVTSTYSLKAVGVDRIVASYPFILQKKDVILVLYGTAININVVKDGIFRGGPIYPPEFVLRSSYSILSIRRILEDTKNAFEDAMSSMYEFGIIEKVKELQEEFSVNEVFASEELPFRAKNWKTLRFPTIFGGYEIFRHRLSSLKFLYHEGDSGKRTKR